MKNIPGNLIAVLFLHLFIASAFSQTTSPAGTATAVNIVGKISLISSDAKQLQILTSSGQNIVVLVDDRSELKRVPAGETNLQNAVKIAFSDISLEDNAFVRGLTAGNSRIEARQIVIVSSADAAKRKQQKADEWKKRGVAGIVKNVDESANQITIELKGEGSKRLEIFANTRTVFQHYRENAVNMDDYGPGGMDKIRTGDQVRALGTKTPDGSRYDAEEIFSGSFRTVNGKVKSINLESSELTLVDSKTDRAITVRVTGDSRLIRLTSESIAKNSGKSGAAESSGRPSVISISAMLENSPRIALADIRENEILVIATASDPDLGKINALTVISGVELVSGSRGGGSGQGKKQVFNLDVF
jgi:hypothetical protein